MFDGYSLQEKRSMRVGSKDALYEPGVSLRYVQRNDNGVNGGVARVPKPPRVKHPGRCTEFGCSTPPSSEPFRSSPAVVALKRWEGPVQLLGGHREASISPLATRCQHVRRTLRVLSKSHQLRDSCRQAVVESGNL